MMTPWDIDARDMACPRPIIELAKLRRRRPEGGEIRIAANDLAFESDVRAWCETTRNPLLRLVHEGSTVIATIQLEPRAGDA